MQRLSDLIADAVSSNTDESGRIVVHEAVKAIKPRLDDESRETLIDEALKVRVSRHSERAKTAAKASGDVQRQGNLFNLKSAHALDEDEKTIKLTSEMNELEFRRIIDIRRKHIKDSTEYLRRLEQAYQAVRPFWSKNPEMTFAEVERLYAATANHSTGAA